MKIDIITLFPKMFTGPFDESILKRAQDKGLVDIKIHNLRNWATNKYKAVDDHPYGGGVGMIMRIDIIDQAIEDLKKTSTKIILLDPTGKKFTQERARSLSKEKHLVLISGHYEGVDHRVHEHITNEVISIGDYVLTGGEIPTMVLVDTVVRLIPGVLSKEEATKFESFSEKKSLEHPQYTRPEVYKGWKVPKILLSGNHKEIEKWRLEKSLARTRKRRPDLLNNY